MSVITTIPPNGRCSVYHINFYRENKFVAGKHLLLQDAVYCNGSLADASVTATRERFP